jgi:hypothetical protein
MFNLSSYISLLLVLMFCNTMQQCDSSYCLKCSATGSYCTCYKGYSYLDQYGNCQTCSYPCYQCTNLNICTSCSGSYVLYGSDCVLECPDVYKPINGVCSLPNQQNQKDHQSSLSAGVIAGIVIGIIFIVCCIIFLIRKYYARSL